MPPRITLIGTLHDDLEGEKPLKKKLKKLEPSHILLEGSEKNAAICVEIQREVKGRIMQMDIPMGLKHRLSRFVDFRQYEHRVTRSYAKEHRTPIEYFEDIPLITEDEKRRQYSESVQLIEGIVAKGNEGMNDIEEMLKRDVASKAEFARRMLAFPDLPWNVTNAQDAQNFVYGRRRDEVMAEKCREVVGRNPKGHIAAIVGLFHIANDINRTTLYEKIRDMRPDRVFTVIR